MEKELPPNHLLSDGKYKILKKITFSEDGGTYSARDLEANQTVLIKECIPPASLSDEDLNTRIEAFKEIMLILCSFDHPSLSKIYAHFSDGRRQYVVMEKIEGVTLWSLIQMSVQAIPEEQVLKWGMQICSALHYLHDRPKPFIFDVLDSTHIMIDGEGQLKLINYGLDRFFIDTNAISFTASRELLAEEMEKLSQTLYNLLTGKNMSPIGVTDKDPISLPLAKILNKLLTRDSERAYQNFENLSKAFNNVLHPPKVKERKKDDKPLFNFIDFGRLWQGILFKFLKQPLWLVSCEVLGVLLFCFLTYRFFNPPIVWRQDAAAYVACGTSINVVDLKDRRVSSQVKMPKPIFGLAGLTNGVKLFCSSRDEGIVYQLNSHSNQVINKIPVDKKPRKMVLTPKRDFLYVLHRETGHVSFVRLDPEALPDAPAGKPQRQDKNEAVFNIGEDARGLAVIDGLDFSKKTKKKVKSEAEASLVDDSDSAPKVDTLNLPIAYCSSRQNNNVSSISYPPINELANISCQSAGPLAITPDKKLILVASLDQSKLHLYDSITLKERDVVELTGGTDIRELAITPDGSEYWCLNGSRSIGIIRSEDNGLLTQVKLQGSPTSAVWYEAPEGLELWVAVEEPNQIEVVKADTHVVKNRIPLYGAPTDIVVLNAPPAK